MRHSFKYRIYPNKEQTKIIQDNLNFCCFLYNSALEERKSYYKAYGKSRSCYDQQAQLCEIKKDFAEQTSTIYSQSLQQVLRNLDKAYQAFFVRLKKCEKAGFPRFKSSQRFRSILFPQCDFNKGGVRLLQNKKLKIFGIPGEVKIKYHRPFQGRCKQVQLVKQAYKFYVILVCDDVLQNILPKTNKTIGIDLGLNSFIVDDEGNSIHHPKPYKTTKEKLVNQQRKLSLKSKGSKNREKQKKSLVKTYEKITNIRNDFLHKTALKLVKENDRIIIEKLSVKGMLESKGFKVSKENISDASWGRFIGFLRYKAERAGKEVIEVNPKNTSKMCSSCGNIKENLLLYDRVYHCEACGFILDRDHNAALNIKRLGISIVADNSASEMSI